MNQKMERNNNLRRSTMVFCVLFASTLFTMAGTIHVTTTGNDENAGTADAPLLTIHKAVELVQPGDTIWVHGGTYTISERIKIPEKATSADRRCYLWAVPGEDVVIDGSRRFFFGCFLCLFWFRKQHLVARHLQHGLR